MCFCVWVGGRLFPGVPGVPGVPGFDGGGLSMGRKVVFSSVPPLFNLCFSFVRFARFSEFARSSFVLFSLFSLCSLSVKGQKNAQIWRAAGLGVWLYLKRICAPIWGCFGAVFRASSELRFFCFLFVRSLFVCAFSFVPLLFVGVFFLTSASLRFCI